MKRSSSFFEKTKTFLCFAGPSLLIFSLVVVIPIFYGIYLTFTDWDGIASTKNFVWFENYIALFQDEAFWASLWLTIKYVFLSVILINLLAFFLAYGLTSGVRGQNFLRAGFFTPNLIGGVILGFIWQFIFSRVTVQLYEYIPVSLLERSWLSSPEMAFAALVIVTVWQYAGIYAAHLYIRFCKYPVRPDRGGQHRWRKRSADYAAHPPAADGSFVRHLSVFVHHALLQSV